MSHSPNDYPNKTTSDQIQSISLLYVIKRPEQSVLLFHANNQITQYEQKEHTKGIELGIKPSHSRPPQSVPDHPKNTRTPLANLPLRSHFTVENFTKRVGFGHRFPFQGIRNPPQEQASMKTIFGGRGGRGGFFTLEGIIKVLMTYTYIEMLFLPLRRDERWCIPEQLVLPPPIPLPRNGPQQSVHIDNRLGYHTRHFILKGNTTTFLLSSIGQGSMLYRNPLHSPTVTYSSKHTTA